MYKRQVGGSNIISLLSSLVIVSVIGLKSNLPDKAIAITISGEETNAWVFGLPSFLFAKFLLNEWTIEFFFSLLAPSLSHWPIHGPHAFVKIWDSKSSKILIKPSLSAVNLTCSEPGLIPSLDFIFRLFFLAWKAIEAARDKSS